jgi:hypothetical protein
MGLYSYFIKITAKQLVLVTAIALLLVGCKDEKVTSFPTITYYSPQVMQEYNVVDTVDVHVLITDDVPVTLVKVNITNEDFMPVTPSKIFYPNATSWELNTRIPIDDVSLETGTYFTLVRAENGSNFKNQYQEILLRGLEREFKQLVVITEGGFNEFRIWGSTDLDVIQHLISVNGDFAASAVSHTDQLLFIAGRTNPNIHAYDLETNDLSWMITVPPGTPVHNEECLHFDELLYATYHYEYIRGYGPSGQVNFNVFTEELDAPERIYRHEDYVLVEMQKKNANNPYIGTYFNLTGNLKQKRFIVFDVIDFQSINKNKVVILANKDGHGLISTYDVEADILTNQGETPDRINGSAMLDNSIVAIAGKENIHAWISETGQLLTLLNQGAERIRYETISDFLYLASSTKVEVFSYPEMVNQKTLLFSDTILDIQIQYSK